MSRKRQAIWVYVTDEEHSQIMEFARRTGLSLSTFAKRVCLGQEVKSLEHTQVRHELRKMKADLGRVGGLIKQLLAADIMDKHRVHRHLAELDAIRGKIDDAVEHCR